MGLFSTSKEELKVKIEKKKGDIEQAKAAAAAFKVSGKGFSNYKDSLANKMQAIGARQRELAELKAKLAKMK